MISFRRVALSMKARTTDNVSFLDFTITYFIGGLRIVRILVWVIFQCELSVGLLDVVGCGGFWQA